MCTNCQLAAYRTKAHYDDCNKNFGKQVYRSSVETCTGCIGAQLINHNCTNVRRKMGWTDIQTPDNCFMPSVVDANNWYIHWFSFSLSWKHMSGKRLYTILHTSTCPHLISYNKQQFMCMHTHTEQHNLHWLACEENSWHSTAKHPTRWYARI